MATYRVKHTGANPWRICTDCGDLHHRDRWPDNHARPEESILAPMVVRDEMEPTKSMVDGSIHTSKRGIRKTYEPSGNREGVKYQELGDDPARLKPRKKPKIDKRGIRDSMAKAQARFDRGERTTDERKFK